MGQESLSFFPSERERGTKPPPPRVVPVQSSPGDVDDGDARLRALFGAIETTPPRRPAPAPAPAPRAKIASGTRIGAALAAAAILGLAGLTMLQPANSAPPETSVPSAAQIPPPMPVVESADRQSSQSVDGLAAAPSPAVLPPTAPPPAVEIAPRAAPQVAPQTVPRARASASVPRVLPKAPASAGAGAFAGTLVVDSVPQGATVLINQRNAGVTPLRLPNHPAGSYAVWVELDGFQRSTAVVRVAASTTTRVNPTLRLAPSAR